VSESSSSVTETDPRLAEAKRTVAAMEAALAEGKAPRGRRPLGDVARLLKGEGRLPDAAHALYVLARLEARRDNAEGALSSIRSALRLVERGGAGFDSTDLLALAARIYTRTGDYDRALLHATQARERGANQPRAVACLAAVNYAAGRLPEALTLAGEAEQTAATQECPPRIFPALLVLAGCPAAADAMLTANLRQANLPAEVIPPLLLLRGWARLSLGDTGPAARDFRKARTLTHSYPDRRPEARALAGLAAAEATRARVEEDTARLGRAETLATRAVRLATRARDTELQEFTSAVQEAVGESGKLVTRSTDAARKAWAADLVALARATENLEAIQACRQEVQRLATIQDGALHPPPTALLQLALRTELFEP
jgi:tetratricopeptide (TPR) repeat protein